MELANIVPPQWGWLFPGGSYRMALAHWALQHKDYVSEMKKGQSYLLVDNGVIEGSQVNYLDLNSAYTSLDADEVILPDVQGDPRETLKRSWNALTQVLAKRVMFVPQGTTHEERSNCLNAWIKQWKNSPFSESHTLALGIVCIRRALGTRSSQVGTRSDFMRSIAEKGLLYPMHLLGVIDVAEFAKNELSAAHVAGVRGIDTSLAFALAADGKLLTPTAPKVHLKQPEEYERLSTMQRRLVFLNQRILSEWVRIGGGSDKIPTFWIRQVASKWLKYHAEGFAALPTVMKACGMPKGRYALLKQNGREEYIKPLGSKERPESWETLVEV